MLLDVKGRGTLQRGTWMSVQKFKTIQKIVVEIFSLGWQTNVAIKGHCCLQITTSYIFFCWNCEDQFNIHKSYVNVWVMMIQSYFHLFHVKNRTRLWEYLSEDGCACWPVWLCLARVISRIPDWQSESILLFIHSNPSAPTQRSLSRFIAEDHGKGQRWPTHVYSLVHEFDVCILH